jgi:hypothetical protein
VNWSIVQSDARAWLASLEDDSADLLVCSPPYEAARTYGIDFKLRGQAWVDWMVEIVTAAVPKVKGLIAIVCEGQTRKFAYSATPFLLIADLHRAGFNLRKPAAFRRIGIPGSGGPDWLRNDYEPIICITRPGKLPWSDNTACGHPPKFAPGGAMSNRHADGRRENLLAGRRLKKRMADGEGFVALADRPGTKPRRITSGHKGGDTPNGDSYLPPVLANPGNVITCKVGGGLMGHDLAHENEAPYPLSLAEFFVRSFCPPEGLVIDPFTGSGTTGHAAVKWGRRFAGCDLRQSQVELTKRRLASVQTELFV